MAGFTERRRVEWGDCDAAGIVYYPNYFKWMDEVFHAFTRDLGFDQRSLGAAGLLGTPLVDAHCSFTTPARYYDDLDITLNVTRLGRTSLGLAYAFRRGGQVVAEGTELRAFVAETGGRIAARPAPPEVRAALEAAMAG